MKYDFNKAEWDRLKAFLHTKLYGSLNDPMYFDSQPPTWYATAEKVLELMKQSKTTQLKLTNQQVRYMNNIRDLDTEFPEFESFLNEEYNRLIDAGKLPMWLRTGA